ncbi:MAG: alpha-L-arabinofuranosidase, partial [Muribaculaceae bacterium]|nr:alpha-L-arabinofuranosidase [Muribaculaceae bacterium]
CKGKKYDLSLFALIDNGKVGKFRVGIADDNGKMLCSVTLNAPSGKWGRLKGVLVPQADASRGTLVIEPLQEGTIAIDMVSLFPRDTFKGRRNGLRRDLADTIAALRPRFVRFPGGCVAHGDGIGNIYKWKNTIGPLESRVPQRNIWGYHQTAGLGYHEYFEFCEDLGAEPLPVVAAGVPCQNSSCGGAGQQGGIPMSDMPAYVQDVLDLVEYANGDARTTRWGAERARNGHPAPFGLKYLGVGNEDLISDVFEERFEMIYNALREKHPEITVIGTVGPFHSGSDYDEGWEFASRLGVPMVDEHYYESPSWFIYNQDFYDGYDRNKPHVYLGEYASRGNELFNALAEAAYLCGVERNGDVVEMTSYAPLLAKEGQTNWNPDMIYFTNTEVHPTVNYRVQRLFGENCGTSALPSRLVAEGNQPKKVSSRLASSVVMTPDGDVVVKLVNILPVEVEADLTEAIVAAGGADRLMAPEVTVLSGDPASRTADLKTVEAEGLLPQATLEPYSFTVMRFKRK